MSYWNKTRNSRITRRRALGLVGGSAAAAAFLAACGGEDDDDDDSGGSSSGGSSSGGSSSGGSSSGGSSSGGSGGEQIKRGGHLRNGTTGDIQNLDPHTTSGGNRTTTSLLLESLVGYDADKNAIGRLATDWELSDEGATITLKIREGVKFHNGAELTAEVVKYNFERIANPELPYPQWALMSSWFPNIEVPDPMTMVLKGDSPRAAANDFLYLVRITDRGHMEGPDAETSIVGTGAFKWVDWKTGVSFEVEKNPDYWQEGLPYLDGYTYNLALNPESMVAQFDSGDLDFIVDPPARDLVRFQSETGKQGLLFEGGRFTLLGFNCGNEPFGDKRVRQAFNWSFDRQTWADLVMHNIVSPASLPWPENSQGYDAEQDQHYSFDLEKASQLLSAAGVTGLETNIITNATNGDAAIMNPIWQNDLDSIGVKLNIELVQGPALSQLLRGHDFYSLFIAATTNAAFPSPATFWAFTEQNFGGNPANNNNAYVNPELDAFVDMAGRELDPDKLREYVLEWNAIILEEAVQLIPARSPLRAGAVGNFGGWTGDPEGIFRFDTAWLA
jgi:peptide/nickel transport system substrate-binding protein